MTVTIFGIRNCDTMKKAFTWLDAHNVDYSFHDYKKLGAPENILRHAITQKGWEAVINRRGTTWRKLPDNVKDSMNDDTALQTALENPSLIKRPLLITADNYIELGFSPDRYAAIFNTAA